MVSSPNRLTSKSVAGILGLAVLASALPMRSFDGKQVAVEQQCTTCEDWPEASFDWKLCDATGKAKVPSRNNLGGQGPQMNDPKEIRYDNVVRWWAIRQGVGPFYDLDLVVTAESDYTPHDISRNKVHNDNANNDVAVHGCFGVINIEHDSTVKLRFAFKEHGREGDFMFSDDSKFVFSVWDMDRSLNADSEESIVFKKFRMMSNQDKNIMKSHTENPELLTLAESNRDLEATSTVVGKGNDNPYSITPVSSKSIEVFYNGSAEWSATFAAKGGKRGRNILFAGCRSCLISPIVSVETTSGRSISVESFPKPGEQVFHDRQYIFKHIWDPQGKTVWWIKHSNNDKNSDPTLPMIIMEVNSPVTVFLDNWGKQRHLDECDFTDWLYPEWEETDLTGISFVQPGNPFEWGPGGMYKKHFDKGQVVIKGNGGHDHSVFLLYVVAGHV